MPPKKKRITPTLIGPVGSTTKKGKKKLLPGKKRLKQRVKSKPKPKKTKRKTKTNDQIAVKLLTHMCNKLDDSMHGLQEVTVCWYNAQEEEEGKEQSGWYCGTTDGSEVTTNAK